MLRLLTDEDLRGALTRGLLRREPLLDLVRSQDVGLSGKTDPEVLEWAAENRRIVLTHDRNTMTAYAYERVAAGLDMPGVLVVRRDIALSAVIEDIVLAALASTNDEHEGRIMFLPFG